jgi:hypothetical protein
VRTLAEILEAAKSGNKPGHEECYWAMLALGALNHFNFVALERLADYEGIGRPFGPKFQFEEAFGREKKALEQSPREWVGEAYDPANPAYQQWRRVALSVFETVLIEAGRYGTQGETTRDEGGNSVTKTDRRGS